jgi:hypothetical protein
MSQSAERHENHAHRITMQIQITTTNPVGGSILDADEGSIFNAD